MCFEEKNVKCQVVVRCDLLKDIAKIFYNKLSVHSFSSEMIFKLKGVLTFLSK